MKGIGVSFNIEEPSAYDTLSMNRAKWYNISGKPIGKELLYEMKYIIDMILLSLEKIKFEDQELIKMLKINGDQLIFMQSADKVDADEVNMFFNNMCIKLESISDESIINMKRKENLDKILG